MKLFFRFCSPRYAFLYEWKHKINFAVITTDQVCVPGTHLHTFIRLLLGLEQNQLGAQVDKKKNHIFGPCVLLLKVRSANRRKACHELPGLTNSWPRQALTLRLVYQCQPNEGMCKYRNGLTGECRGRIAYETGPVLHGEFCLSIRV